MSDAPAAEDPGPFEEQRRIYELLSQETRHLVLQYVLGHPAHLPSLDELAHVIPKNRAAIRDQLQVLAEAGIVERYDHPPNEGTRDLPSQFYGLTEYGVEVLDEYNYLAGLPIARAVYDNTRLSEKASRHRDAPRPDLPETVSRALAIDESGGSTGNRRRETAAARVDEERTGTDDRSTLVANFVELLDSSIEGGLEGSDAPIPPERFGDDPAVSDWLDGVARWLREDAREDRLLADADHLARLASDLSR